MIATGLDVTFQFNWITDERKQLAMNQTTSIIIWNIYDDRELQDLLTMYMYVTLRLVKSNELQRDPGKGLYINLIVTMTLAKCILNV